MAVKCHFTPKVSIFYNFAILQPEMDFYTFGSKIWRMTFSGDLDDEKGSDRALARRKGMPSSGACLL